MQKTKKISIIIPCAVIKRSGHVVFLYAVKTGKAVKLFLSKSKDGLDFSKITQFVEVFSEKDKKQSLKGCSEFRLFHFGGLNYLSYTRSYVRFFRRYAQTVIASSSNLKTFKIIHRLPGKPLEAMAVVCDHNHKKNFLAYHGAKAIYVSASKDLIKWHSSGKLLAPRKGHFDNASLHVMDAITTERGILILYEANKKLRGSGELKIGAALFALDQPYKVLWRAESAIWQKKLENEDRPLKLLGSVFAKNNLHLYWVNAKNEVLVAKVNIFPMGLGQFPKSAVQLKRHHQNPILKPNSTNAWEVDATFNPAALNLDNKIHLIYRAIGERGLSVFGYASSKNGLTIDQRLNAPAFAALQLPQTVKKSFSPFPYCSGGSWIGCEDPRLTQIGERIYMTYVSYDGVNPPGVALTSIDIKDFLNQNWKWRRPLLISKPGEIQKNWMLFPEKINGKYAILHSITPQIAIEYIDDLDQAGLLIKSEKKPGKDEHRWDNIVRGAGAPPLKTKEGWLVFYHAMDKRDPDKYKVGAMILDYKDPTKILHRCCQPILEPIATYENEGAKAGVVYVCGAVIKDDTLFVYYGGADSVVCVATADIHEFLKDLTQKEVAVEKAKLLEKIKQPYHY